MTPSVGAPLLAVGELVAAQSGLVPRGSRAEVFRQIFTVFLVLGTLVCVVVVGYMVYNAYKYRDASGRAADESGGLAGDSESRGPANGDESSGPTADGEFRGRATDDESPRLGDLPSSSGGGRKLFYSFGLSAIIVISLIAWTYGTLLYVEQNPPTEGEEGLEVEVVGYRFGWDFVYPNGHTANTLRVPQGEAVNLTVTSDDVFHTFGVPELRVKTDAIPGQETDTWFIADEMGTYEVRCFELCGAGHSYMTADIVVMEPDEYRAWYENTSASSNTSALSNTSASSNTSALSNSSAANGRGAVA